MAKPVQDSQNLRPFITDFVTYRRDLKYHRLVHDLMEQINIMILETDMQSSKINGLLYEFLEMGEDTNPTKDICSHVIIKADLRGSTMMTAALERQGLNPATQTRFFVGTYPDAWGDTHPLVVREDQVQIWQEDSEDYQLTDILYYEVVTNQKIINTIIK